MNLLFLSIEITVGFQQQTCGCCKHPNLTNTSTAPPSSMCYSHSNPCTLGWWIGFAPRNPRLLTRLLQLSSKNVDSITPCLTGNVITFGSLVVIFFRSILGVWPSNHHFSCCCNVYFSDSSTSLIFKVFILQIRFCQITSQSLKIFGEIHETSSLPKENHPKISENS